MNSFLSDGTESKLVHDWPMLMQLRRLSGVRLKRQQLVDQRAPVVTANLVVIDLIRYHRIRLYNCFFLLSQPPSTIMQI